jgi:SAM-dependent methyltransferase
MDKLNSDKIEKICEQQLFHLPYFRGMLRAVEQSFYERLELKEPIYDLGAGDGHFAWALFDSQAVVGLDPWWQPLTEAQELKVYPLLLQADGAAVPAADASFATAISNSVLEHVGEIQTVLNEVGRVLQPGGYFYFAVPNERFRTDLWGMQVLNKLGLNSLAIEYSKFFNKIARHINLDPPEVWIARLRESGFDKIDYFHYYPRKALHVLERGHAAGLPNLIWKKIFGRWILFPTRKNPFLRIEQTMRLLQNPFDEHGTCTFYMARRKS